MKYHVNVKKFIKFLKYCNFEKIRQKGSHATYSNGDISYVLTIERNTHTYSQGHLKRLLRDFKLGEQTLKQFLYKKKAYF